MITLAIDPGKTTGWAIFDGIDLIRTGVWNYDPLEPILFKMVTRSKYRIVIEDWENQGKRLNFNSTIPVRVIGWIQGQAALLNVPVTLARASIWQSEFARNGQFIKVPAPTNAKTRKMAGAVYAHLKAWPFDETPPQHLPHVLDAVGLGLYFLKVKR